MKEEDEEGGQQKSAVHEPTQTHLPTLHSHTPETTHLQGLSRQLERGSRLRLGLLDVGEDLLEVDDCHLLDGDLGGRMRERIEGGREERGRNLSVFQARKPFVGLQ